MGRGERRRVVLDHVAPDGILYVENETRGHTAKSSGVADRGGCPGDDGQRRYEAQIGRSRKWAFGVFRVWK